MARVDVETRVADLRGRIMGAMLGEAPWEGFLTGLRRLLPNGAATLFYHDTAVDRGAFSLASGLSEAALASYAQRYSALNPWMEAATRRPIGLSVPDSAMFSRKALQRTEFYNDYLLPNELQGAIGITIDRKETCHFFLSVLGDTPETAERKEALTVLRAVVPDLQRAFSFYQRRPAVTGLAGKQCAEQGTMLLGPGRQLRSAEGLAEAQLALGSAMSVGPTGRAEFRDKRISHHVDMCLGTACARQTCPAPRTFLMSQRGGPPLKATVMTWPWAGGLRFFRGPECLVLVETTVREHYDLTEVVCLYRLTQAETRVAEGLLAGMSPHEIAACSGVTFETVRSHLRSLFAKTDTHRQPQLVARLLALAC